MGDVIFPNKATFMILYMISLMKFLISVAEKYMYNIKMFLCCIVHNDLHCAKLRHNCHAVILYRI